MRKLSGDWWSLKVDLKDLKMFLNGGNGKHTKFGEQNGCFGVAEVNVTVIKGIMRGKYLLLRNEDADICRHQATSLVHPPKRR